MPSINRNKVSVTCDDPSLFREKLLLYIQSFSPFAFFDGSRDSSINLNHQRDYDWIAAFGAEEEASPDKNSFSNLQNAFNAKRSWWIGFLTYDLKNQLEQLQSVHDDHLKFPSCYFFIPTFLIYCKCNEITISIYENTTDKNTAPLFLYHKIDSAPVVKQSDHTKIQFTSRVSKSLYLEAVNQLQKQIEGGNVYEVNYCMEFFSQHAWVDPLSLYTKLIKNSPAPFSSFFRINQNYIICASPERFLKKKGNTLTSQPMKGTSPRGDSPEEDARFKQCLKESEKEKAENIMIVDLVRNDLSKTALKGTVKVDELNEVYTFLKVHQMVSTVSCKLLPEIDFAGIIKNTFPMGSMTGAPKISAMQLIEQYEKTRRGVFSGTIGFIDPDGDFDFNVVIRSFLYNAETKYLSIQSGSAITSQSDAEQEYKECLLKAGYAIEAIGGKLI